MRVFVVSFFVLCCFLTWVECEGKNKNAHNHLNKDHHNKQNVHHQIKNHHKTISHRRESLLHSKKMEEEAENQIIFSDVEGSASTMKSILADSKTIFPDSKYGIVFAGDLFDSELFLNADETGFKESTPVAHLLETFLNLEKTHPLAIVHGNRDLNKLRFITEASDEFIAFLGKLISGNRKGAIAYILLRLHYWVIYPNPFRAGDKTSTPDKRAVEVSKFERTGEWIDYLLKETFGGYVREKCPKNPETFCFHTKYSSEHLGFSSQKPIRKAFFEYFSANPNYQKLLKNGKTFHFDKENKLLVMHSGIGDGDYWDLSNNMIAFDPYKQYGGVIPAVSIVNQYVKGSIDNTFASTKDAGKRLVDLLNIELDLLNKDLAKIKNKEKIEDADLFQVIQDFGKTLSDSSSTNKGKERMNHYANLIHSFSDPQQQLIARNWMMPLQRDADIAIDASLPLPLRTFIHPVPAITTSSCIRYYLHLYDAYRTKTKEQVSHLCDLWSSGIKHVVLGHFSVPGPLILRFKFHPEFKGICNFKEEEVKKDDIFVYFIDRSSPSDFVSWAYLYKKGDNYIYRFALNDKRIAEIDPSTIEDSHAVYQTAAQVNEELEKAGDKPLAKASAKLTFTYTAKVEKVETNAEIKIEHGALLSDNINTLKIN